MVGSSLRNRAVVGSIPTCGSGLRDVESMVYKTARDLGERLYVIGYGNPILSR